MAKKQISFILLSVLVLILGFSHGFAAQKKMLFCDKILSKKQSAYPISQMLDSHRKSSQISSQKTKQQFQGVEGLSVYNPTAPIFIDEKVILFARVESADSETDTQVMAFEAAGNNQWKLDSSFTALSLQDPFIQKINGEYILGGVEFIPGTGYRTVFYRGSGLGSFEYFAAGPWGMKDIRLLQLSNSSILVMTRPQGVVNNYDAGPGKIGWTIIKDLSQLNEKVIIEAQIIENLFAEGEWGGVNELHLLEGGRVGALAHIARWAERNGSKVRNYYALTFEFDAQTAAVSDVKIILERSELENGLEGETKVLHGGDAENLKDVIFSGGFNGSLWVGAGDAEVHRVEIPYPFSKALKK